MSIAVVASQTGSASGYFTVTGANTPVLLFANNLAGAEEVDIYISPDGSNWQVYKEGSTTKVLTATITMLPLEYPAQYRVTKDATAGACAVFINYGSNV
jgi:hypothetical protein